MTTGLSQRIRVRGLVQGVGFRPHVWRLAQEEQLAGWVTNDGDGVDIAVSGEQAALDRFIQRLASEAPPLARIDSIEVGNEKAVQEAGFRIIESRGGAVHTAIGPDAAICPACIAEIFTPAHRRWRYAFTTCTHCGPRYTVSSGIPYDRARTSLAPFPLCPTCNSEYTNPADRRFHAETTCCPACGPQLAFCDAAGSASADDPITATLARLQAGEIVAIKGLGGFHLACDARNVEAVARLRQRKAREEKPFAVMALNAASVAEFAEVSPAAETLLRSTAAPIVLCPQGDQALPGIAPGLAELGLMFPATPLHLLLWHEAVGRPAGTDWLGEHHPLLLVMTSANPQGEPLVIGNDEARVRLAGIADAWLLHDRDIIIRCDDSVVRSAGRCAVRGEERGIRSETPAPAPALAPAFPPHLSPLTPHASFLRRARGYTPLPIPLANDGPDVLAFGAYLKNTICVTRGREAFLSQHIGSLDSAATIGFLEETVAHLLHILDVTPQVVAHDLHPDYPSTYLALTFAAEHGIPAIGVGHHHAHIAAVCAEHGITEPVLGLALDGVGLGPDGGLWGGELLRVDGAQCERLGHLAPLPLPGGDRAAREPWRMACSALHVLGRHDEIPAFVARHFPQHNGQALAEVLAKKLNCPATTSLGRVFDAAAGLLGLRATMAYEGQAAMELEALAMQHGPAPQLADGWRIDADHALHLQPLLSFMADASDVSKAAAVFHATLSAALADWVSQVAGTNIGKLVVGGGCAINRPLLAGLAEHCARMNIALIRAEQAPPNDGGLALGQAWVARHCKGN